MSKKRLGKVDTPISASQTFTKVRPDNELNLEDESEDETGTPLLLARTFTGVPPVGNVHVDSANRQTGIHKLKLQIAVARARINERPSVAIFFCTLAMPASACGTKTSPTKIEPAILVGRNPEDSNTTRVNLSKMTSAPWWSAEWGSEPTILKRCFRTTCGQTCAHLPSRVHHNRQLQLGRDLERLDKVKLVHLLI